MPTRLTARTVAGTLAVVLAVSALGGCVASERARYERHLTAMVSPEPPAGSVATGALADGYE